MERLKREAEERGITIQELVRAVIIPTYFKVKIEISLPQAIPDKLRNDPFMPRRIPWAKLWLASPTRPRKWYEDTSRKHTITASDH
jgi:hypothetical protein